MLEENSNDPHVLLHGCDILGTEVLSQICRFVVLIRLEGK